jgi:hypothetical protein
MSYLQCTLPDLLPRFSLLLANGRRVKSGLRFKGRTQDDCQCRLELRSHVYSDTPYTSACNDPEDEALLYTVVELVQ